MTVTCRCTRTIHPVSLCFYATQICRWKCTQHSLDQDFTKTIRVTYYFSMYRLEWVFSVYKKSKKERSLRSDCSFLMYEEHPICTLTGLVLRPLAFYNIKRRVYIKSVLLRFETWKFEKSLSVIGLKKLASTNSCFNIFDIVY
jgi:hypothetical protein